MDAKEMVCWVEEVKADCKKEICSRGYQSVLRCFDIEGRDVLIGAVGRQAGIRVLVSRTKLIGRIDINDETVLTMEPSPEASFESIPFEAVFSLCNQLRDRLKEMISPEFYGVPVLGGLQSIILGDCLQEIANYYLPEIELFCTEGGAQLFTASHISQQLHLSPRAAHPPKLSCPMLGRTEYPDRDEYRKRMDHVLDELKRDDLQKIVIARKCTVEVPDEFDRCDYAAYLFDHYFQEYFYLFRQGGDYWLGISPEIIMKQSGNRAVTKPLAGTRKKEDDEARNAAIREELTSTNKDIVEHEYALNFMVQQIQSAGIGEAQIDQNKIILETPYAFHIKSEISMQLKEDVSCFDVINAIYPPATVWGIPVDRVERVLAQTEPFSRGQFTGVYGYWDYRGNADTALVIRTAQLGQHSVSAYAGGGIVKYSDIDSEFNETVNKMQPLLSYFN
ncbi:chorismate-binding protein [Clostridium phoceensis]|uniref:chorismate-binding protein n=1 Tax=Clostridium phoceensis TaxID=1650661 RepID=UPI002E762E36|nr:chorismate-binding protein [Clostridium phoceensis]